MDLPHCSTGLRHAVTLWLGAEQPDGSRVESILLQGLVFRAKLQMVVIILNDDDGAAKEEAA